MYHLEENLRKVAVMISIVMPDTGRKIPVYGYHRKDSGFNRMK